MAADSTTISPKNQNDGSSTAGDVKFHGGTGCKTCEFAKELDGRIFYLDALRKSGEAGCNLCSVLYEAIRVYVDDVEYEKLEAYRISDPKGAMHVVAKDYDNTLHRGVYLQFFVLSGMLKK